MVDGQRELSSHDPEVAAAIAHARQSWPPVDLETSTFFAYLAERLPANASASDLATLRVDDLYLACACARGSSAAHLLLEKHYLRDAERALARSMAPADADEFRQKLRERLLLGSPEKPPRIATYSGRGRLKSWVRIAARRVLVDMFRAQGRPPAPGMDGEAAVPSDDAEIRFLKQTFREDFQAAFDKAFEHLSPRQRTLLRYRYVDQLDVNEIAVLLQRHRVNISRALTGAREELLAHLRRELVEQMRVASSEVESVIRMMRSQLRVSLGRLLGEPSLPERG